MDILLQDLRYAFRTLRNAPGFALASVLALGLGIGANAAIFGVVNGVLLRPLPFERPDALYSVYTRFLPSTGYDFPFFSLSGPELEDLRAGVPALSVAAYTTTSLSVSPDAAEPERVQAVAGTAELFDVLGVAPVVGRAFAPGEDRAGAPCVTVLSHGMWRERFGAEAAAIGTDVRVDGAPCRIIGVLPEGVAFPGDDVRLYLNWPLDPTSEAWGRQNHWLLAVARVAPDATIERAQAELDALRARWAAEFPDHYAQGHFAVLRDLREDLVGDTRVALLVLFGGVGLLLMIVCANVANLLLSRAEGRRREFAVRAALGADRGRLVRQLMTENLLLAAAGGALGLLLAGWLLPALLTLYPGPIPRAAGIRIDGWVFAFTAGAALTTGLLVGLAPAFHSSAVRVHDTLKTEGRTSTAHRSGVRMRGALVVAEIALSLMLAAGATLLLRSYAALRDVHPGFDASRVLTFGVFVPEAAYPDAAQARRVFDRIRERIAAIRGVETVGVMANLPLLSAGPPDDFVIDRRPLPGPGQAFWNARYILASPGAFEALRMRIVRGRTMAETDGPGQPLVAWINEEAHRLYWPNEDPIGQTIRYPHTEPSLATQLTIAGVVNDVRSLGVDQQPPPAIYVSHAQAPRPSYDGRAMTVIVRTTGEPALAVAPVRAALAEVDPTLPLADVRTMEDIVNRATGRPRFTSVLMGAFAVAALLLGALGIYGVLGYAVQQRMREIGIRMALGASRAEVLRLVVGQGLVLAVLGVLIGTAATVALSGVLGTLLFGVTATDPVTFAAVAALLLMVSLAACWLPARRAIRIDPNSALRFE